jgi:hypothetical protein
MPFHLQYQKSLLLGILLLDILFLYWYGMGLSISKYEANIFFFDSGALHYLLHFSSQIFGQNDFSLRLPFLLLHAVNAVLLFLISRKLVRKKVDLYGVILLFLLLPGSNSAAMVVNQAAPIICLTLIYIYISQRWIQLLVPSLILLAFLDNAFMMLIVASLVYAIVSKYRLLIASSLIALVINLYLFGVDIELKNEGYFLDIFTTYAVVFSPFVFLFFIYTLYHFWIKKRDEIELLWFVAAISLLVSLLLSLKQNISLEEIAPFALIGTPLMVINFLNSYRIRLKAFRVRYKMVASLIITTLLINTVVLFFNKPLYLLLESPDQHFAYENHFTKGLVTELKARGITGVLCDNSDLQLKLQFYGIGKDEKVQLFKGKSEKQDENIELKLYNRVIEKFYLRVVS